MALCKMKHTRTHKHKYARKHGRHAQISKYARGIILGRGSLFTLLVLMLTQNCEGELNACKFIILKSDSIYGGFSALVVWDGGVGGGGGGLHTSALPDHWITAEVIEEMNILKLDFFPNMASLPEHVAV